MEEVHRVAIIDDEPEIRQFLKAAVEENFIADEFDSADAVIAEIEAGQTYDIFLTDIVMPGKDGIAFLRWLRARGLNSPVIIITGNAEKKNAIEALRLGAFAMVEKPFQFGTIFAITNRASSCLLLEQIGGELIQRHHELISTLENETAQLGPALQEALAESKTAFQGIMKAKSRLERLYKDLGQVAASPS